MASRYSYSKTLTTNETKRKYLESTIYPKIKATDNDIYIISTSGDRLDILSNKYYGDKNLWWAISVANNLNDASLHIEPGTQLRIPGNISKIVSDLEKINK
jgi:nucleoid-associated protein YgaU